MKSKNPFFLAACVLFLSAASLGGQQAPTEIKAVPVAGGLYFLEGLDGGNVAFLATEEGVLVVDSGTRPDEGGKIMEVITAVTDKPVKYLVLTHYHGDHTFGLQSYPAATVIIAQQNTADNMRRLNAPRIRDAMEKRMPEMIAAQKAQVEKLGKKKGKERKKEEERLQALEAEFAQLKELRLVYPAITFQTKLTVFLGGQEIEVVHPGRAHTDGDAWVHFPGLKAVHVGDNLFNGSFPYIGVEAGADTANWIAGLKMAAEWDIEKVIPGHGPLADRAGLLRMAAYLTDLREAVKQAIAAGQSLEQAKKMAPPPAWKDLKWPEMFSRNVEAVYNELSRKLD